MTTKTERVTTSSGRATKKSASSSGTPEAKSLSVVPADNTLSSLGEKYERDVAAESADKTTTPPVNTSATTGVGEVSTPTDGKKRGRPRGSKNATLSPTSEYYAMRPMVKAVITFPYSIMANRYGPHWALTDPEAENMIDPHLALLNRYLPEYVKEQKELYAVLLLHGMALMVRMSIQAKINAEQKERAGSESVTSVDDSREARLREIMSTPKPSTD